MSDPAPVSSGHPDGPQNQEPSQVVQPGRPVVLVPTPPGLWMVLLGVAVGAIAPLFGFLIGGATGSGGEQANDPMFLALFLGIVVGGVGALVAIAGAVRLWRHFRDQRLEDEATQETETETAQP